MYDPPFFHGEEDCLYLNIFTSKVKDRDISLKIHKKMFNGPMEYKNCQVTEEKGLVDEEQLPVMVWIHGGAFRIGQTSKPWNSYICYCVLFLDWFELSYSVDFCTNCGDRIFAGRGFSSEESGFLVDQDVVIVSINYRFF